MTGIAGAYYNLVFNLLSYSALKLFSKMAAPLSLPPTMHDSCYFSVSSLKFLSSVILITVILVRVKWYLIVILICNSLMTNNVKYLFVCLLFTCISSLGKYVFKLFAHFKNCVTCHFITEFY